MVEIRKDLESPKELGQGQEWVLVLGLVLVQVG